MDYEGKKTGFSCENRHLHAELDIYQCGTHECISGHSYGPAVRDHFLVHFIHRGKGSFHVDGVTYQLGANQGFLICPGVITYYQADMDYPWHYSWVGFHGLKAESYLEQAGISRKFPVFSCERYQGLVQALAEMIAVSEWRKSRETRLLGWLYLFLSELIEQAPENRTGDAENRKVQYLQKAVEWMERNHSRPIRIAEVAEYIGLDRSYFCGLFKSYLNLSPQEYLMHYRMNRACELMGDESLSIGDISRSVGYEDQLQFSKIFKKVKGVAPMKYRKNIKWT